MTELITKEEYMEYFQQSLKKQGKERKALSHYMEEQFEKFNQLIDGVSKDSFWDVFPKILGIDAKLTLLIELVSFENFSNKDIIRIVQNDYKNYFKELCGYDLKMKSKPSMIFNVS
ncbi:MULTISPECIES: DUF7006 family protein [unclassified Enterococcus]|uniref:DUF7006 family protein n=1 Tax=unclassified Enterococcus TaxID=2608891 RepID=UPI003F22BB17